jgi:hypothetical protein
MRSSVRVARAVMDHPLRLDLEFALFATRDERDVVLMVIEKKSRKRKSRPYHGSGRTTRHVACERFACVVSNVVDDGRNDDARLVISRSPHAHAVKKDAQNEVRFVVRVRSMH